MYTYSDYLYHEGVTGMRWGVRRYQNADGTLTALGRIHYGVKDFYNGPKMEHVKSSIARGWYTANDPEFLGRKMSDVKKSLGQASTIVKDPNFWNQDVKNVRSYVDNYFASKNNSPDDGYHDLSTARQYNVAYNNQNKTPNFRNSTAFEFGQDILSTGYSNLTGTVLLSVFDSRESAKNVKFSDLAKFELTENVVDSANNLGINTKTVRTTLNAPDIVTVQPGNTGFNVDSGTKTWSSTKSQYDPGSIIKKAQEERNKESQYQDTIRKQRDFYYDQTSKMAPDSYKTGYNVGMIEAQNSKGEWMKANKGATESDFNKVAEQWATARGNQFVDEFMKEASKSMAIDRIESDIDDSFNRLSDIDRREAARLRSAKATVDNMKEARRQKYRDIAKEAQLYKDWYLYGNY